MTGHPTERVYFDEPSSAVEYSWWGRYKAELTQMTPTARSALDIDTSYILDRGIFGAGEPDDGGWVAGRTRTGLVMGSVQSGKTASMFGVVAKALDRGVDVVVILAGTRLSLWRQTYERLLDQLDAGPDTATKAQRRLLCPAPTTALSHSTGSLLDTYRLASAQVRRKLTQGRPLVIVAMKQTDHLFALGAALRSSVFAALRELDRSVHMLVLDDEADDGSVLDASVEAGLDPLSPSLKQIPRAIADLWSPRAESAPDNLFTTYVGYTATPQANLLQEDHNPLAPRDFVISLRTPLDRGSPLEPGDPDAPRSSTYPEPTGIDSFYTGGTVFYDRGHSAELCVDLTDDHSHDLAEAVRAYLVAGAIRLHRHERAKGLFSLSEATFASEEEALATCPDPHSMLFHPSAAVGTQFTGAEDILLWAGIATRSEASKIVESGRARLPGTLVARLYDESPLWEAWIERYKASSDAISTEFDAVARPTVPGWPAVRELLEHEIIPGTRISVVNSDPRADDRPEFKPRFDPDAEVWRPPRDLFTIFVSGNVMARGLTLEGMTTALFQRGSNNPYADSQMQMQRWFGYRGKYIEFCRVFASKQQLDLFRSYHDVDEALREGISAKMSGEAPAPVVLHGMGFLATGKIANLRHVPLCPSSRPFVTVVNSGQRADPNADVLARLFSSGSSSEVDVGRASRGRALDTTLSLDEAADLLDQLRFESYAPGIESRVGELWAQVQARVSATLPLPEHTRFYNAPGPTTGEPTAARFDCPYAVAAYLRLWAACLDRPVRGLFVTGVPSGLWSMADLQTKRANQPRFTVGIRYGAGGAIDTGPIASLDFAVPATTKRVGIHGELETTWGANDPGAGAFDYRGDEFFDYYHRGDRVPMLTPGAPWRPEGSAGQILFYVNQLPGQPHPAVAVAICIPGGGPEQFAATRTSSTLAD